VFTARYGLGLQMKRSALRLLKVKLTCYCEALAIATNKKDVRSTEG
jgi:hypothetical protein